MRYAVSRAFGSVFAVIALASPAHATDDAMDPNELLNLSLEDLTNISVTSVSKKAELEKDASAAVYVITKEDIRRSGATEIPELLRMAPGVTVTRAGSHDWTVTARGSNGQFSNKLLVLMDGRTIYSPLFSGVVWDVQDTMIEDIERIEVIRGPGGTLWGANAMNGVINIITKNAKDTKDGLIVARAGNRINGIGSIRYGSKIGDDGHFRAYAKHTNYDSEFTRTGGDAGDNWNKTQAGFRSDSRLSDASKLNVQGDIYTIDEDVLFTIPDTAAAGLLRVTEGAKASGGNIMTRWEMSHGKESQTTIQAYFDNTSYSTSFFNDLTNTLDFDAQNIWTGWSGQEVVWGAGYRLVNSTNDPASAQYSLTPKTRNDSLFSAFAQDKFTILPKELFLTLGSKFEHNNYTGVEIQPSARLSWLPASNQTVWASVSRTVHTPYRYTDDARQALSVVAGPAYVSFVGNRALESEELIAYELGYRIQPTKSLSFDLATFYNEYDDLFHVRIGTPSTFVPLLVDNSGSGKSIGGEFSAKWNISRDWQMAGSYSYIDLVFDKKNSVAFSYVGRHPKHQFNVRSTYLFPYDIEMTNALYYVDDLESIAIPGYYRLDTRFSYPVTDDIELSLIGQNLLDDRHQEFTPFVFRNAVEVGRSVYGSVAFKF